MMLIIAGGYAVTARLGLTLAMPPEKKASAVWPPSGIALAAVLLAGYRIWPGIWLGAFLGNFMDFFDPGTPFSLWEHLMVSLGIALGSTVQAVLGGRLIQHWIGTVNPLDRVRTVLHLTWATPLFCLTAATVGTATTVLGGFTRWTNAGFTWWTWWLGDTVGILIVTPLLLTWFGPTAFPRERRRLVEAALVFGLLAGAGWFVFGGWSPWALVTNTLAYLTVPLVVWATLRLGHHGATASLLLISGIAVWGTSHGHGPFVQKTLHESLLLLQFFVGVMVVTSLTLSAVLTERRRTDDARRLLIERLERALAEIKTLRGLIPICAWCKRIRTDAGSWQQLEHYLHAHTEAAFDHGICPQCFQERVADVSHTGPRR